MCRFPQYVLIKINRSEEDLEMVWEAAFFLENWGERRHWQKFGMG
jgi:hypothetical protein